MRSLIPRRPPLLLAFLLTVCAQLAPQTRQSKQQVQDLLGTSIRSSGTVTISARGDGGNAVVTVSTTKLVGECTATCPSCRAIREFGESPTSVCPVVERIAISVDGRSLVVPGLAYSGMYQPDYARVSPEGSGFQLRILGSDAASGYTTRIYFDETGVQHMVDTYECGTGDETHFLRFAESGLERAIASSAGGAVRASLKTPGETKISLRTKAHGVSASIRVKPFPDKCAADCPDTSNLLKKHAHGSIFMESIKLFFDGKPTPPESSNLSGEGIRNATPLYGTVVDPRRVSLRVEGRRFVLRVEGGEGATANFKEFLFDSQGIQQVAISESPDAPLAVTDFYPAECE